MSESKALITRLALNCKMLGEGWHDKVEYEVPVVYHNRDVCDQVTLKCGCPVKNEKRTRNVRRSGLLEQLREFQQNRDTDRNPKAERGAPRVKTAGKPPGDLAGFFTLDEITCEAYTLLDRVMEEAGRDRSWVCEPLKQILPGLPYQVNLFAEERPDLAREVISATDRWVSRAKQALRITVSDAMFGSTVCGNCNGALAVAWDNASDVRCIGTPELPPCGETYPMSEWLSLYEGQRRASS